MIKNLIAPSILSGDFGKLAEEVARVEEAGADLLHIDIMDGHFVPNLTLGPKAVAAINRATDLFLEVHMMIYNPYDFVEPFVQAGADRLIFHFEATEEVQDILDYIRKCGIEAGLAFNPETDMELILPYLSRVDHLLLMTVHPGFGGQAFIPEVLEKIRFVREQAERLKLDLNIEVDGGIDDKTAPLCREAGANVFVSGNYLFKMEKELSVGIEKLRGGHGRK